jgi:glucose/arabinose dehydrogenase
MRRLLLGSLATCLVVASLLPPALGQTLPPGGTFIDDDGNLHEGTIEAIAAAGITTGCGSGRYCPGFAVTREQMAAFLIRAMGESPSSSPSLFVDVGFGPFSGHIVRIAELGVATGYPDGTFRPSNPISRGEMAVMLTRALDLAAGTGSGTFSDVPNGVFFTDAVEAIAAAGITTGCGAGKYCPFDQVLRDQMASFVARAFGLQPINPPPRATDLAVVEVAAGFAAPVFVTAPPSDPRLFVVGQDGRIWIVRDGGRLAAPFLDLRGRVAYGGERGLLGMAFHPAYSSNRRFFVNYTDVAGDTRIVEYLTSASDPNVADPAPARELLMIDQPAPNHNGGWLGFGPDGILYVAMGDGGGGNDQYRNAQNPDSLLGSILRIDVNSGAGGAEIWAKGLRNPWRNAWDANNLYVADVGQSQREEVTVLTTASAGANLGWPIVEGTRCVSAPSCDISGFAAPIYEYTHSDGCSITGGYVYRGTAMPDLVGTYFFSDYCSGWLRSFRYSGGVTGFREWTALGSLGQVTSFGLDSAGEIYVTVADGRLLKLVPG